VTRIRRKSASTKNYGPKPVEVGLVIRSDAGLNPRRLLNYPPQPVTPGLESVQFAQLFKRRPYRPGPFRHLPAFLPQFPNGVVRVLPCPLRFVFVGVDDENPFAVIQNQDCRLFLHLGGGEAVAGETPALPGRPSESALHLRFARPLWIVAPYEQKKCSSRFFLMTSAFAGVLPCPRQSGIT